MWLERGSNTEQTGHEPLPAEALALTTELLAPSKRRTRFTVTFILTVHCYSEVTDLRQFKYLYTMC